MAKAISGIVIGGIMFLGLALGVSVIDDSYAVHCVASVGQSLSHAPQSTSC